MFHNHFLRMTLAAILGAVAVPAFAQDALCGGAGVGGQWIGGNEGASDISTADAFREQMALVLGGNQYVSLFSLSAPTSVRVEAAGRGAGDPVIDLLDADGGIVLSDDDSGGGGAARAETDLEAGTYCLMLKSFDSAPMTAFVRIGRPEMEPLTEGMTEGTDGEDRTENASAACASATDIGGLGATTSVSADQSPYLSFTLADPVAITITGENETADPVITLYDANGEYLGENDDFDGLNSRLDMPTALAPGRYCIGVAALSDTAAPIDIAVTAYDAAAALRAMFDRGEASPPLDGSYPVTNLGTLETRNRQDATITSDVTWYSVDVADAGLLLVEAIAAGSNGDPWLVIFDDLGRELSQNDDYGSGYDSLATARVTAGTYLIGVKQLGDQPQGFVRLLIERYVPAK